MAEYDVKLVIPEDRFTKFKDKIKKAGDLILQQKEWDSSDLPSMTGLGDIPDGVVEFRHLLFFYCSMSNLTQAQKSYILNSTLKDELGDGINGNIKYLAKLNESQFTNVFGGAADRVWSTLNSNPGAFWENGVTGLTPEIKEDISYDFAFISLIMFYADGSYPTLEKVYDNFSKVKELIVKTTRPFIGEVDFSFGIVEGSSQRFQVGLGPKAVGRFIKKSNLVTELNSKLFLQRSQVENFKDISESGKTYKLVKKDWDKLVELGKTDYAYNVFKEFLKGQDSRRSTIYIYLANLINTLGIDKAPSGTTVTQDLAAPLGRVSLTEQELADIFADENQDFNDKLSQCVLLTALSEVANYSVGLRVDEKAKLGAVAPGTKATADNVPYPYGGRVYCVDTEKPNTLINVLSSPRGISRYIKTINATDFSKDNLRYDFKLYKIVEKDGKSYEFPFLFENSTDDDGKKPILKDLLLRNYKNASKEKQEVMETKTFKQTVGKAKTGLNNKMKMTNFKIGIKGETVATVRSNIDVTINFSFPSLDIMLAQFEATSKYPNFLETPNSSQGKYTYSLSELVSHNIGQKFDGTQASRALNTSYLPKKNRLVLKIIPTIKNAAIYGSLEKDQRGLLQNFIQNSSFILDLTLVNYTAKRTVGVGDDTLQITYKGFTKSFLNEPFCDVLSDNLTKQELLEKERDVVKELDTKPKYCDIKEVRKKIQAHYEDMRTTRDDRKAINGAVSIIAGLIQRDRLFKIDLQEEVLTSLKGNIDKDTKKIIRPGDVSKIIKNSGTLGHIQPASTWDQTGTATLVGASDIKFFYFGDLIDVMMDVVYGQQKTREITPTGSGAIKEKYRARDQLRNPDGAVVGDLADGAVSEIREKFANFPLKVILPVFQPVVLNGDDFEVSTDPTKKISVADIPISIVYFQSWYEEEISRRKGKMYPLGAMINRLLNALVNNVLSDSCYSIGSIEKKYFSIKTDFGATVKKGEFNEEMFNQNHTVFDNLWHSQGKDFSNFIKIDNTISPVLKKLNNIERNKHINYLIVYEQFNAFADLGSIDPTNSNGIRTELDNLDLPQFKMNYSDTKSGKTSDFVSNLEFAKTELPYGEEIRFYNDGLNELSTLSAVHDCTITTKALLSMYPGMLSWVDPSFIDGSEIYGSIPWTMGFGGFHVTYDVEHSGKISTGKTSDFKTIIKSKFVDTGARKGAAETYIKECKDRVLALPTPGSS